MSVNDGFWDLSPEERGAGYDYACEQAGMPEGSFWDLTPEERGAAYEWGAERYGSGLGY